jgi:hypothetical protein
MSAAGEATDARASRAKPRLEERVCEHGWCPTLDVVKATVLLRRAHRRARRRAIAQEADARRLITRRTLKEAAK